MTVHIPQTPGGALQAIAQGTVQDLSITGAGSVESAAFQGTTEAIRIVADTDPIRYLVGDSPTAVDDATSTILPANIVEIIAVGPGQKISVIRRSGTTSIVNITEAKGK